MSQQALDMRKSVQIVRRHKILVSAVTAAGLLGGVGFALLNPPLVTSTALVVLPQAASQAAQGATGENAGTSSYMDTQVVIADSDPVLLASMPSIKPPVSLQKLEHEVTVKATTNSILAITATAPAAGQAENTANAVASGYVTYTGSSRSRVGSVQANVLEPALTATRPSSAEQLAIDGLLGALAGGLAGSVAALVRGREDRRLRERDEIAGSIGVPVLASLPVARPASAEAWSRLLAEYQPGPVHAWQLRRLLRAVAGGGDGSLTILSLASDLKALAIGPQFAVFAAAQGVPTTLVVGGDTDPDSSDATAALRVACAAPLAASASSRSPASLRLVPDPAGGPAARGGTGPRLTIVVLVADPGSGRIPAAVPTEFTMLGVSAGAATAEQLARAAVLAAGDRRDISGIIVADPDSDDRTTGRAPQLPRPARRGRPSRVTSMATEASR